MTVFLKNTSTTFAQYTLAVNPKLCNIYIGYPCDQIVKKYVF